MSTATNTLELGGLDGSNPLGFLAALGTLVAARAAGETDARLLWRRGSSWLAALDALSVRDPTLFSATIADELRGRTAAADAEEKCAAARKALDKVGTSINKTRDDIKRRGLSPQQRRAVVEAEMGPLEQEHRRRRADWLAALKDAVPRPELALGNTIDCTSEEYRQHAETFLEQAGCATREPLDLLAAFGSDACLKKKSKQPVKIEPTPFCFTKGGGHQSFLESARKLLDKVSAERVREALFETWTYGDPGLSMRWDPVEDKRYALTDIEPAEEGASTVWMANLLAYRGLALLPCAPTRRGLGTTAWSLPDEETFTWPMWEVAASPDTIRSLLQLHELTAPAPDRATLRARGVAEVYRARRIKVGAGSNYKLNFTKSRRVC